MNYDTGHSKPESGRSYAGVVWKANRAHDEVVAFYAQERGQ